MTSGAAGRPPVEGEGRARPSGARRRKRRSRRAWTASGTPPWGPPWRSTWPTATPAESSKPTWPAWSAEAACVRRSRCPRIWWPRWRLFSSPAGERSWRRPDGGTTTAALAPDGPHRPLDGRRGPGRHSARCPPVRGRLTAAPSPHPSAVTLHARPGRSTFGRRRLRPLVYELGAYSTAVLLLKLTTQRSPER